jgi:hypothetical protein
MWRSNRTRVPTSPCVRWITAVRPAVLLTGRASGRVTDGGVGRREPIHGPFPHETGTTNRFPNRG